MCELVEVGEVVQSGGVAALRREVAVERGAHDDVQREARDGRLHLDERLACTLLCPMRAVSESEYIFVCVRRSEWCARCGVRRT